MPRSFKSYEHGLLLSYEEELIGVGYFGGLSWLLEPAARTPLRLLAEIEELTASALEPLVGRHALLPATRDELVCKGLHEAIETGGASWLDIVRQWAVEFPAFVEEIAEIASKAPDEDQSAMITLIDHEIAAVEFARMASSGRRDCCAPLHAFLKKHVQASPAGPKQ